MSGVLVGAGNGPRVGGCCCNTEPAHSGGCRGALSRWSHTAVRVGSSALACALTVMLSCRLWVSRAYDVPDFRADRTTIAASTRSRAAYVSLHACVMCRVQCGRALQLSVLKRVLFVAPHVQGSGAS